MPARVSTRAGFLFSADEGFSYDALPREKFVAALDATEALLSEHAGPYFCGGAFSRSMPRKAPTSWPSVWIFISLLSSSWSWRFLS